MFGLEFKDHRTEFPELHAERTTASQTKQQSDGTIISRTFRVYDFNDTIHVRQVDGVPPIWTNGYLFDDPDTLTNPVEIDYHYIVRQDYTITEYTGEMVAAQPIDNKQEYIDSLTVEQRELFIDPDTVNFFRGWTVRIGEFQGFDYYIPVKVQGEFLWHLERNYYEITVGYLDEVDNDFTDDDNNGPSALIRLENEAKDHAADLKAQGYTNVTYNRYGSAYRIEYSVQEFRVSGANFIRKLSNDKEAVFKLQDDTGLFLQLTIQNCSVWLSEDGVIKSQFVFTGTGGDADNADKIITIRKQFRYVIVRPWPTMTLLPEPTWPPYKITPTAGQSFKFKMTYQGKYYLHFKDDILETTAGETVYYEEREYDSIDLEDPVPPGVDILPYTFEDDNDNDSLWTTQKR